MNETGVPRAPFAPPDPPAESKGNYRLKPAPNASAPGPRKGLKRRRFSSPSALGREQLFNRQVGADFNADSLNGVGESRIADDQRLGAVH